MSCISKQGLVLRFMYENFIKSSLSFKTNRCVGVNNIVIPISSFSQNVLGLQSKHNLYSHQVVSRELSQKAGDGNKHADLSVQREEQIAILKLQRTPVNSLNLEYLQNLYNTIDELEKDKSCRGLIIASGIPKIFSAGLDIMEMFQPTEVRLRKFWGALQDFWLKLYMSPLVTVAAISGHSPAGGCIIALSCDYRIMTEGPFTIGLNETNLGIVAPLWFKNIYVNTFGQRQAELSLQLGKQFTVEEALRLGLVDEISPNVEDTIQKAQNILKIWLQVPGTARYRTKIMIREETAEKLIATKQKEINEVVQFIMQDSTQKNLAAYLESLKTFKR
ncbi:enoyl-CoA delta isomerase 1, mitochondrial-like [Limulus polyphemus]|uniref:Enoyl-CoA delta isomerase 1, mitochondrial-like n=1 Tax=Limulus polyphemus TaxID=6850 RepID=A0ABM1BHV6_LIMPO|nr:enoyl-CoA delta isomerase 1, mitochondrial-like [Limulus polyphemus]